jgi:glycosyltransferase involved in cell wall biosynthesis
LSVGIITNNADGYLKRVLESIRDIADEVVIVDSSSDNRIRDLAFSFHARVYHRDFDNFVNQKNYLLSLCKGDWVLFLDDDEILSDELKDEIAISMNKGLSGFYLNRLTNYLGKWIRHAWYPDWQLRLARRELCRWEGSGVHERLVVNGKVGYLKGFLYHYSYTSLSQHLEKINRYTSLFAEYSHRNGKRFSYGKLLLSPPSSFIRRFFLKKGFLDGFEGFIISVMSSYYSFLKYLKLWEIER